MTVRVDSKQKQIFDQLCSEFGMSANTAMNIFVNAVVRSRRIPFEISAPQENEPVDGWNIEISKLLSVSIFSLPFSFLMCFLFSHIYIRSKRKMGQTFLRKLRAVPLPDLIRPRLRIYFGEPKVKSTA